MSNGSDSQPAREANLAAVGDDQRATIENLASLMQALDRVQEHIMGPTMTSIHKNPSDQAEVATPTGAIPALCNGGADILRQIGRAQEKVNSIGYHLGVSW